MLTLSHLSKKYKGTFALKDFSFDFPDHVVTGIIGLNGSGKSTLFKIIAGLVKPNKGDVLYDGSPIAKTKVVIGSMIEEPSFFPNMSGYQNLMLIKDLCPEIGKSDVLDVLKTVGLLSAKDKLFKNYSLGMKQRLHFASAILRKPDILLLDEPFSGIDAVSVEILSLLVRRFAKEGATVLITSHQIRDLEAIVDQSIILDKGEIAWSGKSNLKHDLYERFLAIVGSEAKEG